MKHFKAILVLAIACAGCSETESPSSAKSKTVLASPRAIPNSAPTSALKAATSAGPGTCEEDIPGIRVLPYKKEPGWDKHYDRVIAHSAAYKNCLLQMVLDPTPIPDPGQGPKRFPYALGDLAYDVLADTGYILHGDCIPADIMKNVDVSGSIVIYQWLNLKGNREQVHHCLANKAGI